ncbi:MAG TPA: alpha-galactosidase, partial [Micromonosporaceae bacterium]|nr:alpha-galactosidase [Micromonosporaceae bacterium]
SYVVRLAEDTPRHVHWGAPVDAATARALPAGAPELPELQVRGGVEWEYRGHTMGEGRLGIVLRDRAGPLEITLHYRVVEDSDVIERWITLRHTGTEAVTLLRADSAGFALPARADYRLSHVVGAWAGEFQLRRSGLPVGETVITSRRGGNIPETNPWVMLDAGDATEDHGEVWSAALAWSGSFRITLRHGVSGRVAVSGGFGHDGLLWRLRPGEEWTTPVFAGLYTAGGFGAASRGWHGYAAGRVLPRPDELRPVLYNSWEATGFAVTEDNQVALAGIAAELGVELFVVDDGWFGGRRGDHAGLGDWYPAPEPFPNGLGPLVAEVRRLGMRFGLWVEPEMVNPDSDLYRAHPDWVLHLPGRRRTEIRNQLVLNFARPDVAAWAHEWLDRLVGEHAIDFLKWDMNRPFTEAGWPGADDPDRLWIDHVRAVYAIMDRLRADHPGLRIESCAGGGGRADLGVLARADQVWTSDNTDPVDRLTIQHGFSQVYPARVMAAWVTDSPNAITARSTPLRFRFHVAMAGALGLGGDLRAWTAPQRELATELVRLYKEIRPTVQLGQQYRLRSVDGTVRAVQYLRGPEVVVLAFAPAAGRGPVPLAGLDPAASYRDGDRVHAGGALMAGGLPLELPAGDHASVCVRLTRLP